MNKLGIKYQILLITLIPVFLIDLFFTFNHVDTSIQQENELLQTKGRIISRQIAGASEFSLFTGNDRQIKYLLDQSIDSNEIVLAAIYDWQGELIAEARSTRYKADEVTSYIYHRQPILSQSIQHADVFAPDLPETAQTKRLGWVHLYLSRQLLQQNTRRIIVDSIVFFVTILIMAFALVIIISQRITQPIFRLMQHLKDVETGELGKTIDPVEANEIGAVQRGFNQMTHALQVNRRHLNQRIQQATRQLNEAITDLEAKNRELGFARDEAQNANRSKSEFLANMSHEIRTPINGIKGFISLMNQSKLDRTQQRYVDIILKSTADLSNIVNEILDFSKMESGKLQIVDETFDLHEVIEQTRDLLFINVLTKNIDLNLIIYGDIPRRVVGDKLRLKQILLNLIGNAIKFTDQGSVVIKVRLEDLQPQRAEISITIEDTGIGISNQDQQHLFQAFSQIESSNQRRFSGTGLGLVISKNLANLMGGDIEMRSEPGVGSTFVLRLPFRHFADDDEHRDNTSTAFIFAADETCLMETRSLYDRAGVYTETCLVQNDLGVEPVRETIQRNLSYVDLLVFDLRHLKINLEAVLGSELVAATRVVLMDYDQGSELTRQLKSVEFFSLINTSRSLSRFLLSEDGQDAEPVSEATRNTAPQKRVLLVDDNQVNLKLGSELIRLWGHEVTEADHGSQAIEIFRRQRFDLIILDIQMPDIDGVSLLLMMRQHRPEDPAPIVALTANILNDEAERLLELGFDYFLAKPIDESSFRKLLDGEPRRRLPPTATDTDSQLEQDCSLDYQRSLALSAGNETLLRQIFEILQRDLPDQQQQLSNALSARDYDRLGAVAHKLNGVTCYASLPRLRHQVLSFQQRLTRDEQAPLDELVAGLQQELNAVRREVDRWLEQMDADQTSS